MTGREFKFRAKNVHDGKLYYSDDIGIVNFWMQVKDGHMVNVEQYIGQKLNGQEIFDGDIIFNPKVGSWCEHTYLVEFGEQCDGDGYVSMGHNYEIPHETLKPHQKIIGNKTDNPGLLEKCWKGEL